MLQLLRGHSDDVSRFVVRDGLVVSGGRDKTLVGWRQYGGRHYEFAFAKRYLPHCLLLIVLIGTKTKVLEVGFKSFNSSVTLHKARDYSLNTGINLYAVRIFTGS